MRVAVGAERRELTTNPWPCNRISVRPNVDPYCGALSEEAVDDAGAVGTERRRINRTGMT